MQENSTTKPNEARYRGSESSNTHRREFLKTAAIAGGVVGIGGLGTTALAQESGTEFKLGGKITGWVGRAPSSIEGQTNPTLKLQVGQKYSITWENVDGMPHNVAILDANGNVLKGTKVISEKGATQTLEFQATEEMAEYYCKVHPNSMRGTIQLSKGTTENTTQTEGESDTPKEKGVYFQEGSSVGVETIAKGFISPLGFEIPPGDDRKFIVDQAGQVYIYDSGDLREKPFLDVTDRMLDIPVGEGYSEAGLLGIAFHPNFQNNRKFYVRYSSAPRKGTPEGYHHTGILSEFMATEDLSSAISSSERILLEIPEPQSNHNGGSLAFGPKDGYLYVGLGDGGGAGDIGLGHVNDWYGMNKGGNGQDVTENLLGSILRLDVDDQEDDKPYGIPDDNPLVGKKGRDEHYAWGFRNPWRIGFSNGKLFVGDVGQNLWEEIDIVEKGMNYGWNVREATHCFSSAHPNKSPDKCPSSTPEKIRGGESFIDPIIEYPHTYNGHSVGVSICGGYIYENDAMANIQGRYIFGDYSKNGIGGDEPAGRLFAATPSDEEGELWSNEQLVVAGTDDGELDAYLYTIGRDNEGQLYVLTNRTGTLEGETGAVHRLVPPEQATEETPEELEQEELGENDEDDDGDGSIDEDDEDNEGSSNDDDDGDGHIDEDDEPDDGDDGADNFNGDAEDDDDGDGAQDEDDEPDSGNSDDVDNDGDGAVDEDDEPDNDD